MARKITTTSRIGAEAQNFASIPKFFTAACPRFRISSEASHSAFLLPPRWRVDVEQRQGTMLWRKQACCLYVGSIAFFKLRRARIVLRSSDGKC